MRRGFRGIALFVSHILFFVVTVLTQVGNSGSIRGTVKDPPEGATFRVTAEVRRTTLIGPVPLVGQQPSLQGPS
jgi:hypothetical protein